MPKQKTERQKLVSLIAKQRGIKQKSAYRWLQRIVSGSTKKPKFQLTSYAKKKVKSFVRSEKAKPKKERKRKEIFDAIPELPERVGFAFSGLELLTMYGQVHLGSGKSKDIRTRFVREMVSANQVNDILNASGIFQAGQIFGRIVSYIEEVMDPIYFLFRGVRYGEDHFG